jgi:flagellar protein FliS
MTYTSASLSYRQAAMQHASTVGLVIALYDTLVGDLTRAIEAIERKDIQTRCDQISHGFKVLQHLEMMIDRENGGPAAVSLQRFYRHIRTQMLQAQFNLSTETLHDQIRIVLEVREAWQKVDGAAVERKPMQMPKAFSDPASSPIQDHEQTRISFSC